MSLNRPVPVQIARVWATAIFLCFLWMCLWYVFQPMLIHFAISIDNTLVAGGLNSTNTDTVITLGKLTVNVVFPILIVATLLWAYSWSQEEEYRGYFTA